MSINICVYVYVYTHISVHPERERDKEFLYVTLHMSAYVGRSAYEVDFVGGLRIPRVGHGMKLWQYKIQESKGHGRPTPGCMQPVEVCFSVHDPLSGPHKYINYWPNTVEKSPHGHGVAYFSGSR